MSLGIDCKILSMRKDWEYCAHDFNPLLSLFQFFVLSTKASVRKSARTPHNVIMTVTLAMSIEDALGSIN
jgi:hypothetical protein